MSQSDLFKSEIETLIRLARASVTYPKNCDPELKEQIETVCKRIEGYFEPNLRNPSDMKLADE